MVKRVKCFIAADFEEGRPLSAPDVFTVLHKDPAAHRIWIIMGDAGSDNLFGIPSSYMGSNDNEQNCLNVRKT